MIYLSPFIRRAVLLGATLALTIVGWLLPGPTPTSARPVSVLSSIHAAQSKELLPPCGTPENFSGSINGSDLSHSNYLSDTVGADICTAPRSCPQVITNPAIFHYDTYTFTNPDAAPRQVTAVVNGSGCGTPLGVYSAAYLDSFNPSNLCQNWLASTGGPVTGLTTYSFSIPTSATFVIEVEEFSTTIGCANYGLTVTVQCFACGGTTPTSTPIGTVTTTPAITPTYTPTPTVMGTPPTRTPTDTVTPCPMNFSDVHMGDYFYEAVRYLYCDGAISGYADGTFRPYNNATRAQLCKIVVLARHWPIDTTGGPHFSDVPTTHAFYSYIETAYNQGVITGYADGTFRPGNNITRGQLCKIIVLAMGWANDCPPPGHFSDVPPTHTFFCYIETAYNHDIISGYQDGTFRPGNNATRGQISKIVYQAVTSAE